MAKLYKIVDGDGDCVFNVIVSQGTTAFTIIPAAEFSVVESDYDGAGLEKSAANKFAGWQVTIETGELLGDEDKLGPDAVVEFNTLDRIQLTFSKRDSNVVPLFTARQRR